MLWPSVPLLVTLNDFIVARDVGLMNTGVAHSKSRVGEQSSANMPFPSYFCLNRAIVRESGKPRQTRLAMVQRFATCVMFYAVGAKTGEWKVTRHERLPDNAIFNVFDGSYGHLLAGRL